MFTDSRGDSFAIREARLGSRGSLIAATLVGCWRQSPPRLQISAGEFDAIAPPILGSGTAALVWRKLCASELKGSPAALPLRQAYRTFTLEAAVHERQIKAVVSLLRSAGVEPILDKGWAVARLYPERGLRPSTDIDLVVRPAQFAAAEAVLARPEAREYWVDLHRGFTTLDTSDDELFARSELVKLGDVDVRVLSPEDHLRVLAVHFLRHGGWRPLWLCDIAVALESRPRDFDWDRCLGTNRRADWVACALGLAHQLLGAEVDDTPIAKRAKQLPRWLVPSVLKQWEKPTAAENRHADRFVDSLRHPSRLPQALRERWPDPILATIRMGGTFGNGSPLPFQIGNYLSRGVNWLVQLPNFAR